MSYKCFVFAGVTQWSQLVKPGSGVYFHIIATPRSSTILLLILKTAKTSTEKSDCRKLQQRYEGQLCLSMSLHRNRVNV